MTDQGDGEAPATEAAARHDALAAREAASGAAVDAAAPAQAEPPAELFARRRAELGLSLEDVANQLKFSARQIEALEAGDFDKLPGGTFARGMMRSYARLLKIEPALIRAQLAAAGGTSQTALEEAVSLRAPIPFSEGGNHVNLVYAILSVMLLAVVAFFAFQWYQERSGGGKLAFVRPTSVAAGAGAPHSAPSPLPSGAPALPPLHPEPAAFASAGRAAIAETSPTATEALAANGAVGGASPGAAPVAAVPAAAAPASSATSAASNESAAAAANAKAAALAGATSAASPPPTAVTSAGPGKRRILLHFDRQSWVEIKAARGAILMSQLNPAGTEKVVEGDPPFELTIGNAAGVRLKYNDQPVDLKPYFHVDVARLTLN